jgi:hypothetical protein
MKLYPLIYTNEAAKTSGDAVSSKLGLIVGEVRGGWCKDHGVITGSKLRMRAV